MGGVEMKEDVLSDALCIASFLEAALYWLSIACKEAEMDEESATGMFLVANILKQKIKQAESAE
jgi:hypothetical protein